MLHYESSNEKKYKFIKFVYSLSHSSLFINNSEIYIYTREDIQKDLETNLKLNNIEKFKKHNNLTYEQLLLLFRKIKQLINH